MVFLWYILEHGVTKICPIEDIHGNVRSRAYAVIELLQSMQVFMVNPTVDFGIFWSKELQKPIYIARFHHIEWIALLERRERLEWAGRHGRQ